MKLRRILWLSLLTLLGYCAVTSLAGVFVAEATLHPVRRGVSKSDERLAAQVTQIHHATIKDVSIVGRDGITLHAWNIDVRDRSQNTVILLHGLADNRMGMIGYAALLLHHGFNVLLPDSRAHGMSGGSLATYGLLESDDIRRWTDWIRSNQHSRCIFGFAESMGAAQLLQSLQSAPDFCAVAVESPFSSLREIAFDRVGQFFHTGPWLGRTLLRPVVIVAFAYAKSKYGLDFERLSPERAAAATHIPVLLIHGKMDTNIPVRHSRRIAAQNSAIALWEVAGADHCGAISIAPGEFEAKLINWFNDHSKSASQMSQQAQVSPRLLHIAGNLLAQGLHGWKLDFVA